MIQPQGQATECVLIDNKGRGAFGQAVMAWPQGPARHFRPATHGGHPVAQVAALKIHVNEHDPAAQIDLDQPSIVRQPAACVNRPRRSPITALYQIGMTAAAPALLLAQSGWAPSPSEACAATGAASGSAAFNQCIQDQRAKQAARLATAAQIQAQQAGLDAQAGANANHGPHTGAAVGTSGN